jgi:hypothetical protein
MPLHDYTKQIYEDAADSAYIIRFLDYLIGRRYRRTTFTVNGIVAEPLITGVLENTKTKERYYSIAQFYTAVTGLKVNETDISLLSKITITPEYSVMRVICNMPEEYILEFFDQRYRIFLMYRDVRKRIKHYTAIDTNSEITLRWNDCEYTISHTRLENKEGPQKIYNLLEAYEDGFISGLYYCEENYQHLITDS